MKRVSVIFGLILLVAAAAAGALLGLFRLTTAPAEAQGSNQEQVMVIAVEEVINGERFGAQVRVTFADPAEVPDRAEDAAGLFMGREGEELTLGTGAIEVELSVEVFNDQELSTIVNASHDGPDIKIMVDEDTSYYRDVTEVPKITREMVAAGALELTRILEPGRLDEIGENMTVRAWGVMEDNLLIADLVIYDPIE